MERRLSVWGRVGVLALVGVFLAGVADGPDGVAGAAPPGPRWTRPVDGALVRAFEAPRTRFGPGHRGVDFAAAPGTPVVAAGAGVVVFAGSIGPSSHVVVLHPVSGWRTGYSFLESVAVHRGAAVSGGTVVGTSGGAGDGHDGSVLHFSLRIGDEYVDPMILFRPLDLGAAVHLAPTDGDRSGMGFVSGPMSYVAERTGLLEGLATEAGGEVERGLPRSLPLSRRRPPRRHRFVRWRYF